MAPLCSISSLIFGYSKYTALWVIIQKGWDFNVPEVSRGFRRNFIYMEDFAEMTHFVNLVKF